MGPARADDRTFEIQGCDRDARNRDRHGHRAGRCCWMERFTRPVWQIGLERNLSARNLLRRTRISRSGIDSGLLGGVRPNDLARSGEPASVSAGWKAAGIGADLPE